MIPPSTPRGVSTSVMPKGVEHPKWEVDGYLARDVSTSVMPGGPDERKSIARLKPADDGPRPSKGRVTIFSTDLFCLSWLRRPVQTSSQQYPEHGALASDG